MKSEKNVKKSVKVLEKPENEQEKWIKEVLLKNGIDIEKEKNSIKEKAEKFKNNPRVNELQMAFNIIINEIVEIDIEKENFYDYLYKRLKEFSKSYEKFKEEKKGKENLEKV